MRNPEENLLSISDEKVTKGRQQLIETTTNMNMQRKRRHRSMKTAVIGCTLLMLTAATAGGAGLFRTDNPGESIALVSGEKAQRFVENLPQGCTVNNWVTIDEAKLQELQQLPDTDQLRVGDHLPEVQCVGDARQKTVLAGGFLRIGGVVDLYGLPEDAQRLRSSFAESIAAIQGKSDKEALSIMKIPDCQLQHWYKLGVQSAAAINRDLGKDAAPRLQVGDKIPEFRCGEHGSRMIPLPTIES